MPTRNGLTIPDRIRSLLYWFECDCQRLQHEDVLVKKSVYDQQAKRVKIRSGRINFKKKRSNLNKEICIGRNDTI